MRIAMTIAAVIAAAGCGKGKPSAEACAAYRGELDQLRSAPPAGLPTGEAHFGIDETLAPPVAEHGRPIPADDLHAMPGFALQRPPPPGSNDPPPPPPPPIPEAGAPAPAALYAFADRAAPIEAVREEVARWPAATEVRLVVQRPTGELIDLLGHVAPVSPAVREVLTTGPAGAPPGDAIATRAHDEVARRSKSCPGVARVLELRANGGTAEVLGPRMSEALADCGCDVGELGELRALFAAAILPLPRTAYLPVPRDVLAAQPPGATVADLARAVAR
jgi:hypothetical protein